MSSPQPNVDAFQNSFNLDPPTHNRQLPSSHAWVLKSIRAFQFLPVCIPPSGWKAKVGGREPWTLTPHQLPGCTLCLGSIVLNIREPWSNMPWQSSCFFLSVRILDIWRWEEFNLCAYWRNHCRVIAAVQNEARDHVSQVCDTFWSYCARTLWRFGACVPFDPHTLLSLSAHRVQCRQNEFAVFSIPMLSSFAGRVFLSSSYVWCRA